MPMKNYLIPNFTMSALVGKNEYQTALNWLMCTRFVMLALLPILRWAPTKGGGNDENKWRFKLKTKQPVQALAVDLIHIKEQFFTDLVIQRKVIYLDKYKFVLW